MLLIYLSTLDNVTGVKDKLPDSEEDILIYIYNTFYELLIDFSFHLKHFQTTFSICFYGLCAMIYC